MRGYQVTLTDANSNYNVLTLVREIDTSFVDSGEYYLQAEDDGGAQIIRMGDTNLSDTRYGWKMTAGDSTPMLHSLGGVFVRSSIAGKKLNVLEV